MCMFLCDIYLQFFLRNKENTSFFFVMLCLLNYQEEDDLLLPGGTRDCHLGMKVGLVFILLMTVFIVELFVVMSINFFVFIP